MNNENTYAVIVDGPTIHSWRAFIECPEGVIFNYHLLNTYTDLIVAVQYTTDKPADFSRTITFKSEAHYTWFLLQQ